MFLKNLTIRLPLFGFVSSNYCTWEKWDRHPHTHTHNHVRAMCSAITVAHGTRYQKKGEKSVKKGRRKGRSGREVTDLRSGRWPSPGAPTIHMFVCMYIGAGYTEVYHCTYIVYSGLIRMQDKRTSVLGKGSAFISGCLVFLGVWKISHTHQLSERFQN